MENNFKNTILHLIKDLEIVKFLLDQFDDQTSKIKYCLKKNVYKQNIFELNYYNVNEILNLLDRVYFKRGKKYIIKYKYTNGRLIKYKIRN